MTGARAASAASADAGTSTDAEPGLVVVTEALGGGPLARAALEGRAPTGWFEPIPASAAAWRERAESVRAGFRAGAWLELLEPALAAQGAAAERLGRVAAGAGVVVTTGPQPGLFGGPLYTITKAITARALADAVERATGVPAAPVFWAATDDADFAEASRTVVALPGGAAELRARSTAPDATPMALVPLGDDVPALFARVEEAAGSAAFVEALDLARRAYRPGATVGGAYLELIRALLAPLGVAVLDASHAAVREAGFHVLRRALLGAADIERATLARSVEIAAEGLSAQVADVPGRALVFRTDGDGRKERVAIADARGLVTRVRHGELSPNVLLRPVVERAILPTVAYAAGPGELAYFAQVGAVAEALGVATPLAVPRWSATVIEPHVRRLLDRHGLDPRELADPGVAEGRLARAALPPAAANALSALREAVGAGLGRLAAAAPSEVIPAEAIAGAGRALAHRLDRLERRLVAGVKRREAALVHDVGTARGALYPLGARQERAVNALPMLARHGPALWDALFDGARRHADALVATGRAPAP